MTERSAQPPSAQTERKLAGIVMTVASVIYGVSLLLWLLILPLVYSPPPNVQAPTVVRIGILGWPVALAIGLGAGWWKRRYLPAILGSLAPALVAAACLAGIHAVKPEVFDPASWVIDPKALTWMDGGMGGIMLGEDASTTLAILGSPWATMAGERTVPVQDGVTMAQKGLPVAWQYRAVCLTVGFDKGRSHEIEIAAPCKRETVRGLLIGADISDALGLFGEHGRVTTESDNGRRRSVYSFENPNLAVTIAGDFDGKVQKVSVAAKKECTTTPREGWCPPGY